MAQQQRGRRTRSAILDAAASVFNEFGYEGATIAQILAKAELTKGALYFHFTSKEELARGVLAEAVTTEGVLPQESKLQEWVDVGLALAYRLPREPLLSASLKLSLDLNARRLFGTRWQDWVSLMTDLLVQAKAAGELLPDVDPQATARLLVGAWTGVQVLSEDLPDSPTLEEQVALLYAHLLPAIAVSGTLARLDTSPDRGERIVADFVEATKAGAAS
ncbi:ScbR family autoregulator-binding transcription factor [Kitasatospora sp. NPDC056783]|uniref:ScbR family autoregulator-binding transcription factor n=1 Tax=Kitasatospora sp. NPDC056783 TaxID=3345943 RepID=UPI0036C406F5